MLANREAHPTHTHTHTRTIYCSSRRLAQRCRRHQALTFFSCGLQTTSPDNETSAVSEILPLWMPVDPCYGRGQVLRFLPVLQACLSRTECAQRRPRTTLLVMQRHDVARGLLRS
jgi:hypothetical protein